MSLLNEDLNDSALFCKSLIQKRKASSNINPKSSKQLKLSHLLKSDSNKEKNVESDNNSDDNKNVNLSPESHCSTYFNSKTTSNTCPLCLKPFKSDAAYSSHMKQCAKTHKMTTQQLLEALELQKKQMLGGINLSLGPQPSKKISSNRKRDQETDSYDLALGLAISKSLTSCETKAEEIVEEPKVVENKISSVQVAGVGKKKNEKKTSLKERSAEDRQKIIIEKVALVLLDEEGEFNSESKKINSNLTSCSDQLNTLVNMAQRLWNDGQNGDKRDWYVDEIKNFLFEDDEAGTDGTGTGPDTESILIENLDREISKLSLPQNCFHENWKKMINNSKFSDLTGRTKDSQLFYLHSVVVFARFPEILEKDYKFIFEKYNLSTVVIFLEYLYCGTLSNLVGEELKELCNLANDFDYVELVNILNCLKNNLSAHSKTSSDLRELDNSKKGEGIEDGVKSACLFEKDLFEEANMENLTQKSLEFAPEENNSDSETEFNAEMSYLSFLQQEKKEKSEKMDWQSEKETEDVEKVQTSLEKRSETIDEIEREEETDLKKVVEPEYIKQSEDSATRDLDDEFKINSRRSSDCIILSSGSESQGSQKDPEKPQFSPVRTPSPVNIDYEIPYYDPYDNFHCFAEERFSPVELHSQSLITGEVSSESLKLPEPVEKTPKKLHDVETEEQKKSLAYCSTPVTVRRSFKMKLLKKDSSERIRKRKSNLPASRIVRKSLGLHLKEKNNRQSPFQRRSTKRKETFREKDLAEVLTDSILNELSKSAAVKSSTPTRMTNFVEITPVSTREEFGESVTPSPNYSNMDESLLKEHLSRYGLKKNLGKNKAKKILRHIYEELHPLYNTKTGKIVKMLPTDTPKVKKKSKAQNKTLSKNAKSKQNNCQKLKKIKKNISSSKESVALSDGSSDTLEGPSDDDSDGSEFENLSETLTQTVPSNPLDLPSAFFEFLDNNPKFYEKIILYEPIWLEELQKNLKESFKKHFKIADLMEFLDQKCITFRSATQVRNTQKKNEKRKEMSRKRNTS